MVRHVTGQPNVLGPSSPSPKSTPAEAPGRRAAGSGRPRSIGCFAAGGERIWHLDPRGERRSRTPRAAVRGGLRGALWGPRALPRPGGGSVGPRALGGAAGARGPAAVEHEASEGRHGQTTHADRQTLGQAAGRGSEQVGMVPPKGSKFVCPPVSVMDAAKMLPSNCPPLLSVTAWLGATMVPCHPTTVRVSLVGNKVGERFHAVLSRSTSMVVVFSFGGGWLRSSRCSTANCRYPAPPPGIRSRCSRSWMRG